MAGSLVTSCRPSSSANVTSSEWSWVACYTRPARISARASSYAISAPDDSRSSLSTSKVKVSRTPLTSTV